MKEKINKDLIYPSIKMVNKYRECKIDIVKNDVLPRSVNEAIYFRIGYRFESVVIDCLAEKYSAKIDDYSYDANDEHFIVGSTECGKSVTELNCRYMEKAWAILVKKGISKKKVIGIYLLNLDESDENAQKFIALTTDKVYIRWQTKKLEEYTYNDLIFDSDGIKLKSLIPGLVGENNGYIVDYSFDKRFLSFSKEIILLQRAVISGINDTHPASKLNLEKKSKYLSFLIMIAASSKNLTAKKLLKLEYLAREFGIEADQIIKKLRLALKGGIKDNKLPNEVASIVADIPEEIRFVFYEESLEFIVSNTGEIENSKLHQILSKQTYAGESFVKYFCEFLKLYKISHEYLENSFLLASYPNINLPEMYRLQNYNNALMLQILLIGVDCNE